MPQNRFLRAGAYAGSVMAIIGVVATVASFILNDFTRTEIARRQLVVDEKQLRIDEEWLELDVQWNADIVGRLDTVEDQLDILLTRIDDGEKRFDDLKDAIDFFTILMSNSFGVHEGQHH